MALGDIKTFTVEYPGELKVEIQIVDNGDGTAGVTFTLLQGSLNLNAIYLSDGDGTADFAGFVKKDSNLNMNGTDVLWDEAFKLSSPGLGKVVPDTYLTTVGQQYVTTIDIDVVNFSELAIVGLRATSTSTSEGSIKGVADEFVFTPGNVAPETNDSPDNAGLEDAASIAVALSGTDDGTVDSFKITSLPANGTLYADAALTIALAVGDTVGATGDAATVYFVPAANWNGVTDFTYASIDNDGAEDATPATATITVDAVNDVPETDASPDNAGLEDAASIAVALSGNDDADAINSGSVASFKITSLPANGTLYADAALTIALAVGDTVGATGDAATVYFVPDENWNGVTDFEYAAIDNDAAEDASPATATITVEAVNDAPTDIRLNIGAALAAAAAGNATGDANAAVNTTIAAATVIGTLAATDADTGDVLTFAIASDPSGRFEIVSGNTLQLKAGPQVIMQGDPDILLTIQVNDGLATYYETFTFKAGTGAANTINGTNTSGLGTLASPVLGDDVIFGFRGADILNDNGVLLQGTSGDDALFGGAASDTLYGGAGNDQLFGGGSADTLYGGAGNDQLFGGAGKDIQVGGAGADVFHFLAPTDSPVGAGRDVITDFTPGTDKINLQVIDSNTNVVGNQTFAFVAAQNAGAVNNSITWQQVGSNTIVRGDVNGDGVADFEIELIGLHNLTVNDFAL